MWFTSRPAKRPVRFRRKASLIVAVTIPSSDLLTNVFINNRGSGPNPNRPQSVWCVYSCERWSSQISFFVLSAPMPASESAPSYVEVSRKAAAASRGPELRTFERLSVLLSMSMLLSTRKAHRQESLDRFACHHRPNNIFLRPPPLRRENSISHRSALNEPPIRSASQEAITLGARQRSGAPGRSLIFPCATNGPTIEGV